MNKEIWKDIEGYEGFYQVSNLGNVRSLNYGNKGFVKNLKPRIVKDGYYMVNLKNKNYQIHQLVAKAFISNPNNYVEINHKDENKHNNCADNLEWCSREYNVHEYFKKRNKFGVVGICIKNNKYCVRYKKKHLGYFKTYAEALNCLDNARKEV